LLYSAGLILSLEVTETALFCWTSSVTGGDALFCWTSSVTGGDRDYSILLD